MAVICFDFDGTLADTLSLEEKYYLPALKNHGVTIFQDIFMLKEACHENYYAFCEKHGISEEILLAAAEEYKAELAKNKVAVSLFDGISELLLSLLRKHNVYIVSLNESCFIENLLADLGIVGFCGIIGRDEAKDKRESLRMLQKRHEGESFYFVSDVVGDMVEAADAEVPHILAVSYGWGTKEDLLASAAEIVFDTVAELGSYLETIE